jgi:hypothetical protein
MVLPFALGRHGPPICHLIQLVRIVSTRCRGYRRKDNDPGQLVSHPTGHVPAFLIAADPKLMRVEALRQAMIELMDGPGFVRTDGKTDYTYAHPSYWAPYSIVGDGAAARSDRGGQTW